ncbi:MAG: hypothetical protein IJ636_05845 [Bacteroidales bacterium]|nr:hypothetical protein [Bacteroidales bacterium]
MKRVLSFLAVCLFVLASCEPEPVLSLDKDQIEFGENGGSQTVAVTANNTWNVLVESTDSFISVSPMGGSENGFITITAQPNNTSANRSVQMAVICTSRDMSVTKVVNVSQTCAVGSASFDDFEIDPSDGGKIPAEGGSVKLKVVANGTWTLSCSASDVTLSQTTGSAGTQEVVATVPGCPVFEGRDISFTLICRTAAGGSTEEIAFEQKGGVLNYAGEVYHAVKMKDGKWWMTENLRYVPSGLTPSSDKAAVNAGIWYPLVIDVLDENTATVKFSTDAADIKANGYLYSTEVALGLQPGGITAENAGSFEGTRGICPEGWHIPTKADIVGLVGKTADKNDTNPEAPYYDAELNGGNGSVELLNAAGFNAGAWGAVSIANAASATGTTMGAIKAYQKGMNTGYIAGSTMRQVTTNDDGSLKNVQYVAIMPNMNTGTFNGAWNNYRNGVSVRCVKND